MGQIWIVSHESWEQPSKVWDSPLQRWRKRIYFDGTEWKRQTGRKCPNHKEGCEVFLSCSKSSLEYFADVFHEFSAEELESLWNLLKKLYRFDGKEQDGFEKDINYGSKNGFSDSQLQEIQEFGARRIRDASNKNIVKSESSGQNE